MKLSKPDTAQELLRIVGHLLGAVAHEDGGGLMLPSRPRRWAGLQQLPMLARSPKWNIFAPVATTASTFFSMALEQL